MKRIILLTFLHVFILNPLFLKGQVNVQDSLALVDLYNSTGGPNWISDHYDTWLTTSLPYWGGVEVENNRVVSIQLTGTNLTGSIPLSIGNLTQLKSLVISGGDLSGEIPETIGNLTALTTLVINNSNISGEIPISIGNLTALTYLRLDYNNLSGEIPSSIGNLTALTSLVLHHNPNLSGGIPSSIGNLTALTSLELHHNPKLTGEIPFSIGNLTELTSLDFYGNNFSGEIPSSIGNLKALTRLDLYTNDFTGEIPSTIGNLTGLTYLNFLGNNCSGEIPSTLGNLTALTFLSFDYNNLSGEIPSTIGNLTALKYLNFGDNNLSGEIPISFGNLTELTSLGLDKNSFNAFTIIPQNLNILSLRNNQLNFDDLIPFLNKNLSNFKYAPQDTIVLEKKIFGDQTELIMDAGGTQTTYQWFYNKVEISGATDKEITISADKEIQKYHCEAKNSLLPDLTLIGCFQEEETSCGEAGQLSFCLFDKIKDIFFKYDEEKKEYNMQIILSEQVVREYTPPPPPVHLYSLGSSIVTNRTGHIDILTGDTVYYTETCFYLGGVRQGPATYITPNGVFERHYSGNEIILEIENKSAEIQNQDTSAFQILNNWYPWYLFELNSFGFEDDYLLAYMDTLESLLQSTEFEPEDFNTNYNNVLDRLSVTPYDFVTQANIANAELEGYFKMKYNELRLAVIDRYLSDGDNTYNILSIKYPGYLQFYKSSGIADHFVEEFCNILDSTLSSFGSLDLDDPFLADSVDVRLYRALRITYAGAEDSNNLAVSLKTFISNGLSPKTDITHSSPSEIALTAMQLIYYDFSKGNILKSAVEQSYWAKNGINSLATVSTSIAQSHLATSVPIDGYIPRDGGSEVTTRGVAWGTIHNPTIENQIISSGTGTGTFTSILTGLQEGETYYARAYAVNKKGTAYGNCIRFIARNIVSIEEKEINYFDFKMFPNPSSECTTLKLNNQSFRQVYVTIVNMKGQVVYKNDFSNLSYGENELKINVSGLKNGMYNCRLVNNKTIIGNGKLLINR